MKRLFLFLFCSVVALAHAQVYDFPLKPGMEDWGNLKTEKERFAVLQIPEERLSSMSTHDLMITCLNYPRMGLFMAFNSSQYGMDLIIRNFNGLRELLNRDDAPMELLSLYRQMYQSEDGLKNWGVDQSFWSIRRCYFELLLSQDDIIDKMSESDRAVLADAAREKLFYKMDNQSVYSGFDYTLTLKILNRTLKGVDRVENDNASELLSSIASTGFLGQGVTTFAVQSNGVIYTPNGTAVPLSATESELTEDKKNQIKNDYLLQYPNIIYVSEATTSYNCHGYAWYMSDGHASDKVWIDNGTVAHFWRDGSYVFTTTPNESSKVYFLGSDHSAIQETRNGISYLKSKWGKGPVFLHTFQDCPYSKDETGFLDLNYYNGAYAPSQPIASNFVKNGAWEFSAAATCTSQYPVTAYEWRVDYPGDWSVVPQNSTKSSVKVYGSSNARSCYLSARACNKYGWGAWQTIGWLYASSTYSLSVVQNPVSSTLQVRIEPKSGADSFVKLNPIAQEYRIGLYNRVGSCVYQTNVNANGNNEVQVNIDVSSLSNGIYILHVKDLGTNENPQTLNIVVKH